MKKIILAALVVASLFASCSSEKTFRKKDGSTITAKPYGWASKENKVEGVNYELNAPDVVASIIFAPSPYGEEVFVTSKMAPDNVFKNRRVECATVTKDSNGFIILWKGRMASITHWKPIEKLEE